MLGGRGCLPSPHQELLPQQQAQQQQQSYTLTAVIKTEDLDQDNMVNCAGGRLEANKESTSISNSRSTSNSSSTSSNGNVAAPLNGNTITSDVTRSQAQSSYSPGPNHKIPYSSNGTYSPGSTVNGTSTPSPPALSSPPGQMTHDNNAGTASREAHRQIVKVRRFLTTLHQFAADISQDVGDRVRHLILGLLSGAVSVEEFHMGLQEVTHFPLRPFVLPFLRSHLPLLQRDLQGLARRAAVPVSQYVAIHESALLEATAGEPTDFFSSEVTSGKRRHEGYFENGEVGTSGGSISPPPAKRLGLLSPSYTAVGLNTDPSSLPRDYRIPQPPDDEWKNIHVMLTCILSMVEKTRRALTMLQQKEGTPSEPAFPNNKPAGLASTDLKHRSEYDAEVRRHAAELVSQSIRSTEERVAEVKRKAEEAVSEVRRAAVAEVQRAVTAAETRAQELVVAERAKVEMLLREVGRRDPQDHRPGPQQACWNCGRKAHETCSGCNVARYCGPFCQHKDWDSHHKVCSPSLASSSTPSTSATTSSSPSTSSASAPTGAVAALINKTKFIKGSSEIPKSE